MSYTNIEDQRKRHRERYHECSAVRERVKAGIKKWRAKNNDKVRQIGRIQDKKRQYDPARITLQREVGVRLRIRQKLAGLERYGGSCAYCGETRFELLCVDHVNDDGGLERKERNTKKTVWHILAYKEYQPESYQVLCHNCNAAKQYYGIKPNGNTYLPMEHWIATGAKRQEQNHHH